MLGRKPELEVPQKNNGDVTVIFLIYLYMCLCSYYNVHTNMTIYVYPTSLAVESATFPLYVHRSHHITSTLNALSLICVYI